MKASKRSLNHLSTLAKTIALTDAPEAADTTPYVQRLTTPSHLVLLAGTLTWSQLNPILIATFFSPTEFGPVSVLKGSLGISFVVKMLKKMKRVDLDEDEIAEFDEWVLSWEQATKAQIGRCFAPHQATPGPAPPPPVRHSPALATTLDVVPKEEEMEVNKLARPVSVGEEASEELNETSAGVDELEEVEVGELVLVDYGEGDGALWPSRVLSPDTIPDASRGERIIGAQSTVTPYLVCALPDIFDWSWVSTIRRVTPQFLAERRFQHQAKALYPNMATETVKHYVMGIEVAIKALERAGTQVPSSRRMSKKTT